MRYTDDWWDGVVDYMQELVNIENKDYDADYLKMLDAKVDSDYSEDGRSYTTLGRIMVMAFESLLHTDEYAALDNQCDRCPLKDTEIHAPCHQEEAKADAEQAD